MNTEHEDIEEVETEEVVDMPATLGVVGAIDRAQVDVQVATAKKYPRSIDRALKEALTLATMDEDTAGSMFYVLPRSGKKIEGPSARLAEVMTYSWQNLRAEADVIDIDGKFVTAMGTCFDMERNVAVRVRVKRRITDKNGVRYNDDMIGVTSNAACSIALRNAVFKVIPQALTKRIYEEARKASIGKAGTFQQKRQNALAWFVKAGISEKQVFELLGVKGADDLGEEQLIELRGIKTALTDGDTTVEQLLTRSKGESDGAAELNAALRKANGGNGVPSDFEETSKALFTQYEKQIIAAAADTKKLDKIVSAIEDNEEKLLPEHRQILDDKIQTGRDMA